MKRKPKARYRYRCAITGRFVSARHAERRVNTTIRERGR